MSSEIIAAATALILFVLTQGLLKFILEPIQDQRKLIGEVSYALLVYNVQVVDSLDEAEARRHLRELSGSLQASLWSIPFYDLFGLLHLIPKRGHVMLAVTRLITWSDHLDSSKSSNKEAAISQSKIAENLGIKTFQAAIIRLPPAKSDSLVGELEGKPEEPTQDSESE